MDKEKRLRRKKRIRAKIFGTKERPRLSVFRTNRNFYAQLIDDEEGKTIIGINSLQFKENLSNKEKVIKVAEVLSEKAKEKGIRKIVFDRNGFSYKGRIKIFADKLRESGLEF